MIVPSGVTRIAAGREHSLFTKSNGSLWAMGRDTDGQLGNGDQNSTSVLTPQQIVASGVKEIAAGGFHSLFIKSDGSLWGMGRNVNRELGIENGGADIHSPTQIVAGGVQSISSGAEYHSLFIKEDGSLWGMGRNGDYQLGW